MFSQTELGLFNNILGNPTLFIIFTLLNLWALVWKGIALWKSAKSSQRNWFIALLIINTFGILEIVYIFYLNKPKNQQTKEIDPKA